MKIANSRSSLLCHHKGHRNNNKDSNGKSTVSAETLSTYDAVDEATYIGHMLTELYHEDYLQTKLPVIVYTYYQSLHENLHSTKQVLREESQDYSSRNSGVTGNRKYKEDNVVIKKMSISSLFN